MATKKVVVKKTDAKKAAPKKAPVKKVDEVLVLAKKLHKLTADAMKPVAKFFLKQNAVKKVAEPKAKGAVAKGVVTLLKANTNAFGCHRSDVVKLLTVLTGEPILDMLGADRPASDFSEEDDQPFLEAFYGNTRAGCVFVIYGKDTVLMTNSDENTYLEKQGNTVGYDSYYFPNAEVVRPATVEEIEAFIRSIGIKELKGHVVLL
jgi:hypothetical protein